MALMVIGSACGAAGTTGTVDVWRLPEHGRLPRAVVDDGGTVHAVYVTGDGLEGDLWYVTRAPGDDTWSAPVRVNSAPGTVTGVGPIDGGQLALGRGGRVHVAWFRARPTTFFYTRSNEDGPGFEPQFGLASGDAVEASPAVTADDDGNVYMFWHSGAGEDADRSVFMSTSHDDGFVWDQPRVVNGEDAGACACCNVHALFDAGTLYVSYRGAGDNERRGQRLLTSTDGGLTFSDTLLDPWELRACPVSTTTLGPGPDAPVVAWETKGQVLVQSVASVGGDTPALAAEGSARTRRKNPTVAVNGQGAVLLAWGDGPGFRSGGSLHWQISDAEGRVVTTSGEAGETVPDASTPAVVALPDDTFAVVY